MNWLLLPEDEAELGAYLVEEQGLTPLGPQPSADGALPRPGASEPREFVYWAEDLGPIARLGEAPEPTDPKDAVLRRLNQEKHPDRWQEFVDLSRTPAIRLHRANWNRNGCLNPGLLTAMAVPVKDQPPALVKRLRATERWLKRAGERLNPFDHCTKVDREPPRNLNMFWVWARPSALAWVRDGGEVWPWNA